jgi:hypothetical protein
MNSRETKDVVAYVVEGPIEPGNSFSWKEIELTIPPIPPSRMDHCKLIDIDYYLLVTHNLV